MGLDQADRRLGIKIHVDRKPTFGELSDMARRTDLSIVWLDMAA